MKTTLKLVLGVFISGSVYYLIAGTSFPLTSPAKLKSDTILVKTKWKQMGGFEKYTPDHLRLGCWSTALAQIVYFHKLKPFGTVSYTSRNGYNIHESIDSSKIHFESIVNQIDSTTEKEALNATARYNYYAALAVQKDFGTDRYMNKLAYSALLEQHYQVKVNRYISWRRVLPNHIDKLEKIIREELDEVRPVFLHFSDLKGFGHSVVIDGYKTENKTLVVHINQGQGGPQDGWYAFNKSILRPGDDALRVIYTIKPNN